MDSNTDQPESNDRHQAVPTLRTLLHAGCRPNSKTSEGKTPLQILAESSEVIWGDVFGYGVITLLSYGARLDDSPQCQYIVSKLGNEIDLGD